MLSKTINMIDLKFLYDRIRYFLFQPKRAWELVLEEDRPVSNVSNSFLIPLAVLLALAAFAGSMIYDYSGLSVLYPILTGLRFFLSFYLTVRLSAWVITEISVAFVTEKNYSFNYKLISFSLSPLIITLAITRFFPLLVIINILGLYGVFIMWLGLDTITNYRNKGQVNYFIMAFSSVLVFYFSLSWICGSVLEGLYFAFFT